MTQNPKKPFLRKGPISQKQSKREQVFTPQPLRAVGVLFSPMVGGMGISDAI